MSDKIPPAKALTCYSIYMHINFGCINYGLIAICCVDIEYESASQNFQTSL